MTLIRVSENRAAKPIEAVLTVLNAADVVETEAGDSFVDAHVQLGNPSEQEGRTAWLWRLSDDAPRGVVSRGKRYSIEADTGAVRRRKFGERWTVREGAVVRRQNGAFDVLINDSLSGATRLVDEAIANPTGAYRTTTLG